MGEYAKPTRRSATPAPARAPAPALSGPAPTPPGAPRPAGGTGAAGGLVPLFPQPAQAEAAPQPNRTGLPDRLKAGVESLSGMSLDDVRVHYRSPEPRRVAALAYTRGTEIHLGPGQERHLAHEAWHVVQQKQGRVRPTGEVSGESLNDDPRLEREADSAAARAQSRLAAGGGEARRPGPAAPGLPAALPGAPAIQRKIGFEFETGVGVRDKEQHLPYNTPIFHKLPRWAIRADNSSMEFITRPLEKRGEVEEATSQIADYVATLEKRRQAQGGGGLKLREQGSGFAQLYDALPFDMPVAAKPQVTFGLPFENIRSFLDRARTPLVTYDAKASLTDEQKPIEGGVDAITAGLRFADKLRGGPAAAQPAPSETDLARAAGFVTLVVRYLYDIFGRARLNRIEYAKAAISILVRTDFASLFKAQSRAVQQVFSADSIEEAAQLEKGTLKDFPLFGGGFDNTKGYTPFTAADWITSIKDPAAAELKTILAEAQEFDKQRQKIETSPQPTLAQLKSKDLLSRGAVAYDSTSLGAFRLSKEEGDFNSDLPLLEFRELANAPALPWTKWREFALECFALYAAELKLEETAEELAPAIQAPAPMPAPLPGASVAAPSPKPAAAAPAGPFLPPRLARVLLLLLVLSQLLRQVEAD